MRPNLETRVGRMMGGLLATKNKAAKVLVTVQVIAPDGGKKLHDTFSIKRFGRMLYVGIPDTADWAADPPVKPATPLKYDLDTAELVFDHSDPRCSDLSRYAANAALRFAFTGTQPSPANGEVRVVEEAHCGACGLPLKDPESIRRGIGPDCEEKLTGVKRKTTSRRITPRMAQRQGQASIDDA